MKLTNVECKKVAENISNPMYNENLQATKELIELFDKISRKPLKTVEDYVKFYDDNFYTYSRKHLLRVKKNNLMVLQKLNVKKN